jgi:hypothetical protein
MASTPPVFADVNFMKAKYWHRLGRTFFSVGRLSDWPEIQAAVRPREAASIALAKFCHFCRTD